MAQTLQEFGETINMEHVADSALESIEPGRIIDGEIVTVDTEFAYVNVGTKSDGRVPLEEFSDQPSVGDSIQVMLKGKRLVDGLYQFSKNAADEKKQWDDFITESQQGDGVITGTILNATSKGKIVQCGGINAFLPFSLTADLKNRGPSEEKYEFKIKSVDRKKRSVILSRKELIDEVIKERWERFAEKYSIGDRITGEVIKFVEFGAFIRIEGLDALLHRNDMSWKKVFKQRKLLKLGEVREFIILDINREEGKISLGLKQLNEDPWVTVDERCNPGDDVEGTVVTVTTYGAFVEIEDGVEGFVSSGDISWTKNTVNVKDVLHKGETRQFRVLDVNRDDRKISLGMKQMTENPWQTVDERLPVGSVHTTRVKKKVKFGIFVELEDDIDGLVHNSDISWDESRDAASGYSVGDEVEVKILEIKKDEMKIACGMKQLTRSPWESIKEKYNPRTMVEGTISGITQFGLFVKIEDDVEGLVHISEVSRKRIEDLEEHYSLGEEVSVMVIGVDVEKKRLSLSIKQHDIVSEKKELEKILKDTKPGRVTIGDMINFKNEE